MAIKGLAGDIEIDIGSLTVSMAVPEILFAVSVAVMMNVPVEVGPVTSDVARP